MSQSEIAPAGVGTDAADWCTLWREPRGTTLLDIVAMPGERYAALPACLISPDGRACEHLSWGALWQGALTFAGRLATEGVSAGQPVMLAAPTSTVFFTAFFGILAAGGLPVPVALPPSRNPLRLGGYQALLAGIIADAGVTILVTTSRFAGTLEACTAPVTPAIHVLAADEVTTRVASPRSHSPGPHDLALLQYTSGSTGQPKGVALTHANILENVRLIADTIVVSDSSAVSWLPLHHDMGLIGAALTGFYTRRPVLFLPPNVFTKEPAAWLRAISAFRATITLAPNFAFAHAVRCTTREQLVGVSLQTLRTVLNGAEPVDVASVEAFEEKFAPVGLKRGVVRPVYGLAESALAVTFADEGDLTLDVVDVDVLERDGVAAPAGPGPRTRRFVSVGRALATQELRIVDEQDRIRPERVVGEVLVRGPSVMLGYYNRPAETRATLRGDWLHTGDLGYLANGQLYLTGRLKELIIRHGRNYYPSDIETVIGGIEGVVRNGSAAFALDDAGEPRVIVVAETRLRHPDELTALARRIREQCHKAFLFGPDDVRLVSMGAIPRTTSGKVRRDECRRLYVAAAFPAIVAST